MTKLCESVVLVLVIQVRRFTSVLHSTLITQVRPMRWFWLDRFTEFVSGSHATAVKGVSLSEDHLHDHWPYYPVMPNSLVAEGMAQAAACW